MEKIKQILVIIAPFDDLAALETLRVQVCAGLRDGVLVLPEGADFSVEKIPVNELEVLPKAPDPPPEPVKDVDVALQGGRCADEKREIQLKLQAYRAEHGLGCWRRVAEASGGTVTEEMLRDMASGTGTFGVAEWRKSAVAVDACSISREADSGGGHG